MHVNPFGLYLFQEGKNKAVFSDLIGKVEVT